MESFATQNQYLDFASMEQDSKVNPPMALINSSHRLGHIHEYRLEFAMDLTKSPKALKNCQRHLWTTP
jgi:hypothetical protein